MSFYWNPIKIQFLQNDETSIVAKYKGEEMRSGYAPRLDEDTREKGVAFVTAIVRDIEDGRLTAGTMLPGSRTLAQRTGLHRSTIVRGLEELIAEGWLRAHPAKGTSVSETFPLHSSTTARRKLESNKGAHASVAARAGFPIVEARSRWPFDQKRRGRRHDAATRGNHPRILQMTGGLPDLRLVPGALLSRAIRQVLQRDAEVVLDYGDPRGDMKLREVIAHWVGEYRGVVSRTENVMIVRGAQMAFALLARALFSAGDRVAVEAFGYPPAWRALGSTGAELLSVDVDGAGMRVEDLKQHLPLRAIYVTPHHQHPTGATLSASRRRRLLAFARRHRIAIIEDDYDHEVHYDGRAVPPLTTRDRDGVSIYVGTLSKAFAPGVRTGFVIAAPDVIARMSEERVDIDRQGDQVTERALAALIDEGAIDRHTRKVTRIYRERRDSLVEALRATLGDALVFEVPRGGMALWARTRRGIDPVAWQENALEQGLAISVGRDFAFAPRGRIPFLRVGFAAVDESEISLAAKILAGSCPR